MRFPVSSERLLTPALSFTSRRRGRRLRIGRFIAKCAKLRGILSLGLSRMLCPYFGHERCFLSGHESQRKRRIQKWRNCPADFRRSGYDGGGICPGSRGERVFVQYEQLGGLRLVRREETANREVPSRIAGTGKEGKRKNHERAGMNRGRTSHDRDPGKVEWRLKFPLER